MGGTISSLGSVSGHDVDQNEQFYTLLERISVREGGTRIPWVLTGRILECGRAAGCCWEGAESAERGSEPAGVAAEASLLLTAGQEPVSNVCEDSRDGKELAIFRVLSTPLSFLIELFTFANPAER